MSSNSKRKFSESNVEASGQGESQSHGYDQAPKRQKNKNGKKAKTRPENLNWVKKRARTIERKFRTGHSLPANKENDLAKELAYHKQKIEEAEDEKKKKKMLAKYHMVRFFERKKADRLAKQIEAQIEICKDPEEVERLRKDLHVAQIDSLYAKFFPFRERYVSLYPVASGGPSAQEREKPEDASSAAKALKAERPKLWGTVEKLAKKGIPALLEFRERKLGTDSRAKAPQRPSKHSFAAKAEALKAKSPLVKSSANYRPGEGRMVLKNPKKSKAGADSDSESGSEGGFFEEA